MTVEQIIASVRFCYDEEKMDGAAFGNASANDNTYMDNIIKSKIGDAVRWICLYAPAELLGGSDETAGTAAQNATGILVDVTDQIVSPNNGGGIFELPANFIKLARVRVQGWHRAVIEPLAEDSEEYLQLYDDNGAKATYDRPQAAIINRATKKLEIWPWTGASTEHPAADAVDYTYVAETDGKSFETGTSPNIVVHYPIPPRVKTAFIYYLAFLVLSAYEDSRAARMLEIAKMNIGKNG